MTSEELRFDLLGRLNGSIKKGERSVALGRLGVKGPSDHFLSGSRFSNDQDRGVEGRDVLDLLEQPDHGTGCAENGAFRDRPLSFSIEERFAASCSAKFVRAPGQEFEFFSAKGWGYGGEASVPQRPVDGFVAASHEGDRDLRIEVSQSTEGFLEPFFLDGILEESEAGSGSCGSFGEQSLQVRRGSHAEPGRLEVNLDLVAECPVAKGNENQLAHEAHGPPRGVHRQRGSRS